MSNSIVIDDEEVYVLDKVSGVIDEHKIEVALEFDSIVILLDRSLN